MECCYNAKQALFLVSLCMVAKLGVAQLASVKNINTTPCSAAMLLCSPSCHDISSMPSNLAAGNGKLYFFAKDNTSTEIWESDGSPAGTLKISNIGNNYSAPSNMLYYNDNLYFTAQSTLYGQELFRFNLKSKTYFIIDIYLGSGGSNPTELTLCNNYLVFAAAVKNSVTDFGRELVFYDGNTLYVKDLRVGTAGSSPAFVTVLNNQLYFSADGNKDGLEKGIELWNDLGILTSVPQRKTDIASGTSSSNPRNMTLVGDYVYFTATDPSLGAELCRFNIVTNAYELIDLYAGGYGSAPEYLVELEGKVFFSADINTAAQPNRGRELASYTGTTLGVADLVKGSGSSNPSNLFKLGTTLYYVANKTVNDVSYGYELWKRAANNSSTTLVKDINSGINSSLPSNLIAIGDTLFFMAFNNNQWELWKTSGTAASYAGDLNGPSAGSGLFVVGNLTSVASTLFFTADNGSQGTELWKYVSGTNLLGRMDEESEACSTCHSSEQEQAGNTILLYPNPAREWLFVQSAESVQRIIVLDLQGVELVRKERENKVDISVLPRGMYWADVTSETKRERKKFIVE